MTVEQNTSAPKLIIVRDEAQTDDDLMRAMFEVARRFPRDLIVSFLFPGAAALQLMKVVREYNNVHSFRGNLDIQIISRESPLLASMRTPAGYFARGTVYARHPVNVDWFCPVADYHNYLLSQKQAEFLHLMVCLGAKSISRQHSESVNDAAALKASAAAPHNVGTVNLGGSGYETVGKSLLFAGNATITEPPFSPPHIPDGLFWYQSEPEWQAIAKPRMGGASGTWNSTFRYNSDYGISMELSVALKEAGLNIGGSFVEMKNTEITYTVDFWTHEDLIKRGKRRLHYA
jgi:hypothetical protein